MVKRSTVLVFALILIVILGTMFFLKDRVGLAIAGSTFIKPQWGRLECQPDDASINYPSQNGQKIENTDEFTLKCDDWSYTNECEIIAKTSDDVGIAEDAFYACIIPKNQGTCNPQKQAEMGANEQTTIATITNDQKMIAKGGDTFGGFTKPDGLFYIVKVNPWKIFRFEGSQKTTAVADGCFLMQSTGRGTRAGVPEQDFQNPLTFTGGEGSKWIHYIYDWIPTTGYQVFEHPDEGEVYCSGGKIFELTDVILEDGRVLKVDPAANEPVNNDDLQFRSFGSFISNVECCPYEPGCADDFTRTQPQTECTLDIECANGGAPVAQSCSQIRTQICVSDDCIWRDAINVECTADQCCGSGEVCDLINYECIDSQAAPYCGDGKCLSGESNDPEAVGYCPTDCGIKGETSLLLIIIIIVLVAAVIILIIFATTKKTNTLG